MATFRFELVSPEAKLISEDVTMVTIPAEEGVMGVLTGHSPVLTSLKAGVVEVRMNAINENNPRLVFVAGGFADVGPDHCTVLAEEAVDVSTLNAAQIDEQIAALTGTLAKAEDAFEKERIEAKIVVLVAKRALV